MAGPIVFAAAFCTYLLTCSAAVGWLDSAEFVAASASLGVAQSPGHPLQVLLGHLAGYLPVGDLTFRINATSAVLAAAAATALMAAGRMLLGRMAPQLPVWSRTIMAAAVALVFAFSWACWFQAVRAEVYALQALLLIGAMAATIAFDEHSRTRWLWLAGLLGGLALANHHFMALTFLLPAAVFVFARGRDRRPRAAALGICAALGIVGLAALLYLPVRATQHPDVDWGAPQTFERFAWTVSAKAFQKSVGRERPRSVGEDSALVGAAVLENLGLPLAALALLGLYLGIRTREQRRITLLLASIAAFGVGARALVGFEPATPDHHAYLLAALAALALLGLSGAAAVADAIGAARPRIRCGVAAGFAALLVLLVPLQVLMHGGDSDLRGAYASTEVARAELEDLPPRALVLVSYFETSYRIAALRAVEQSRPDVTVLDLGFLTYPGTAEESRRRSPELSQLIDAPLRIGSPLPIAMLRQTHRPVFVQLQPELDAAALPQLLPRGPFAELLGTTPTAAQRAKAEADDVAWRETLAAELADPLKAEQRGVRDTLLWHDFNRLRFYCRTVAPVAWKPPTHGLLDGKCELTELPMDQKKPSIK